MEPTDVSLDTEGLHLTDYSAAFNKPTDKRRPQLADLLAFFSLGLLGIFICSTISGLLSVDASDPTWRLQLIKSLLHNGSLPVMAIVLLELAVHLNFRLEPRSIIYRRLSTFAAIAYLLLSPLHIGGLMQGNHNPSIGHVIEKTNLQYSIGERKLPGSEPTPRQLPSDQPVDPARNIALEKPQNKSENDQENQPNSQQLFSGRPSQALSQTPEVFISSVIYAAIFGLYSGALDRILQLLSGARQSWEDFQARSTQQSFNVQQSKDDRRRIAELRRYRKLSEKMTNTAIDPYQSFYDDSNNG